MVQAIGHDGLIVRAFVAFPDGEDFGPTSWAFDKEKDQQYSVPDPNGIRKYQVRLKPR